MTRRDGPTTMGAPFYGPGQIRSGTQMGSDEREQRATRALRTYLEEDATRGPAIRQALRTMSAHDYAVSLKLIAERDVTVTRRGKARRR